MTQLIRIPFNKPHLAGRELVYIRDAHKRRQLAGDGFYTKSCQTWMNEKFGCNYSLLTHSATAALEMIAILADLKPGDEVIMPSYTFVSTANAFVLRGIIPVFVDIRKDTINIDESLIEQAITKKTKAIIVVHYAGVACDMDEIRKIAKKHNIPVMEDAAHAFLAKYKDQYLGTVGDMAAFSFHETKNIISGEGGALFINKKSYIERAQIIREKGTNRTKFFEGKVDKYTWVDVGSSYLPGEIIASFLMAQLDKSASITKKRLVIWKRYHKELKDLEKKEFIRRPIIPQYATHNAHLYYILTRSLKERDGLIGFLKERGILAVTHYIPLHSSPAGKKFGKTPNSMNITDEISETLVRLPLYYDLTKSDQGDVIEGIHDYYKRI